jgi:hypothetical protein
MTEYDVGDLVKDHFGRIFVITRLIINRDGNISSVCLSYISGKSIDNFYTNQDGFIRMFPTDLSLLKAQGVDNA